MLSVNESRCRVKAAALWTLDCVSLMIALQQNQFSHEGWKASTHSVWLCISGLQNLSSIDAALIDKPWTEGAGDSGRRPEKKRIGLVSLWACGSQWDEMEKEEEKKSSFCCCSPALQAEIRLINSRDNAEMSSMTSILGAETQQHHCAAVQPALCWVNSYSPGRKELIDGSLQPPASVHC